jgi:hypothetical protein
MAFFSQTLSFIGTDGLWSCSVILIVSPHAAPLGHASPLPDNANLNDLSPKGNRSSSRELHHLLDDAAERGNGKSAEAAGAALHSLQVQNELVVI